MRILKLGLFECLDGFFNVYCIIRFILDTFWNVPDVVLSTTAGSIGMATETLRRNVFALRLPMFGQVPTRFSRAATMHADSLLMVCQMLRDLLRL